jgi:hypothetical protein
MFGYVKDHLIYIKCPKNGCRTYTNLLGNNGWNKINLFENNLNLTDYVLWGHITNPHTRHTKGVEQYLINNPEINIEDSTVGKMLVSAVFDEHTYSLSMMLGNLWHLPIQWIPLDVKITKWNQHPVEPEILTGDDLTNDFFKEHNVDLLVTIDDRINTTPNLSTVRVKIDALKEKYYENYSKLVKNFLEPDIILYNQIVAKFEKKYLQ